MENQQYRSVFLYFFLQKKLKSSRINKYGNSIPSGKPSADALKTATIENNVLKVHSLLSSLDRRLKMCFIQRTCSERRKSKTVLSTRNVKLHFHGFIRSNLHRFPEERWPGHSCLRRTCGKNNKI